ncbi:Protein CBG25978 [Caenorhabditis briggsae]|uniref:Protein CBG25978 n=1 Tax=Caenorhabditis briggsae TaxID=6238 RepID=B6IKS8_CAEBR|nr:Protein CBG25978 [Caenorhabditis briggsae]CAS00508.1 Protein CBG25978 [Caenorhabditis briggsae]
MRLSELKLNCPKCSYRTDASNIRKHIKRFHGVTEGDLAMNRETAGGGGSSRRISCPVSDCDVAKWVADRCKKTTTSFIVNKTVATASGKTIYHNCQHEGFYERTGDVRYGHDTKKQTKEATCPAFLRVGQINAKRRKNGN